MTPLVTEPACEEYPLGGAARCRKTSGPISTSSAPDDERRAGRGNPTAPNALTPPGDVPISVVTGWDAARTAAILFGIVGLDARLAWSLEHWPDAEIKVILRGTTRDRGVDIQEVAHVLAPTWEWERSTTGERTRPWRMHGSGFAPVGLNWRCEIRCEAIAGGS